MSREQQPRTVKDFIRMVLADGYVIDRKGKHFKVRTPTGGLLVTFARTPSDGRALRNIVAEYRRAIRRPRP
jgi:predicted RNA binding protein YcfA (HicA-like mRNA interferase family)